MLPTRWYPLKHHDKQQRFFHSAARFNVVPAGRRSGKTEIGKRRLVRKAIGHAKTQDGWFVAAAPTRSQAKRIFWNDLKLLVPRKFVKGRPQESELIIPLVTGTDIQVMGLDAPTRAEGRPLDHILLDEYGNMRDRVWSENIRPALSNLDRLGSADLIGVPEGRNHYYQMAKQAQIDETGDWSYFTWPSSDILPASEIAAAKAELDARTFRQEYEGSFELFSGRVYYTFNVATHVLPLTKSCYDPGAPLIFCFDFNVSPGVAVVCQELPVPHPLGARYSSKGVTAAIGEVWIPDNSNTPTVCRKLLADWGDHRGEVHLYGDPSGGARGTAKVAGNDWTIIKEMMQAKFGPFRLKMFVPASQGAIRSRVNAMNSRLQATDGDIRLLVDNRCKHLIEDLDGVRVKEGTDGEIDKDKDKMLTHLTDALGYYIVKRFPVGGYATSIQQV